MKKLYAVGIGAGDPQGMTIKAREILEKSDVIAGYTVYCDLIKPLFPHKEYLSSAMKAEEARCRLALEAAAEGKTVSMICSGDSGVYGMASLLMELAPEYGVGIEVIPGVTAALSGSALLGSPLTADFAVISLSDLLTPMETIVKRLHALGGCDMPIAIYNPSSKKRGNHLRMACEILLEYRSGETVCGITKNIGREGEEYRVMTLAELKEYEADMFTTVFIGSSETKKTESGMLTPRGYRIKGRDENE